MKTLFVLLILCSNCYAFDDWSKTDYALQTTYTVLHVVDWMQTHNIRVNRYGVYKPSDNSVVFTRQSESNTILGKEPSESKINIYFASTLLFHNVISYVLPSNYRKGWQCITIGFEGGVIAYNYNAGVRLSF